MRWLLTKIGKNYQQVISGGVKKRSAIFPEIANRKAEIRISENFTAKLAF
jgi:hypothetical protein